MEKYDLKKHGVSQGLLSTFMRCRTEAANWIRGLESMRTSQGLQFGTMAHVVLETIYGANKGQPSREEVFKALERARKEYLEERGGRLSAEETELIEVNMGILEAVLPNYFIYRRKDFKEVKWIELEKKFRVPSPVEGIDLVGRIDGAFDLRKEFWLRENKTSSRIDEATDSNRLAFDFQQNTYSYALKQKYGKYPIGCLRDIIRRPGERQKVNESIKQYRNRIEERVKAEPDHYFIRYEVSTPMSENKRFVEELRIVIQEFKDWTEGKLKTYRNTSACVQQYGPCRYLPLCAYNELGSYRQRKEVYPELARP